MHRVIIVSLVALSAVTWVSPAAADFDAAAIRAMLEDGKREEVKRLLEHETRKDPQNHEAFYYLGYACLGLGDSDLAVRSIKRAIDISDDIAKYRFWLSQAYGLKLSNSGRFKQMRYASRYRKALERTIELDPDHLQARLNLVMFCLQAPGIVGGGIDKAFKHARIASRKDERRGGLMLAQVYQQDDNPDQAEAEYKRLEQRFGDEPDFFTLYNAYGYFLLGQGRHGEAIKKLEKQVALAPDRANPYDSRRRRISGSRASRAGPRGLPQGGRNRPGIRSLAT